MASRRKPNTSLSLSLTLIQVVPAGGRPMARSTCAHTADSRSRAQRWVRVCATRAKRCDSCEGTKCGPGPSLHPGVEHEIGNQPCPGSGKPPAGDGVLQDDLAHPFRMTTRQL